MQLKVKYDPGSMSPGYRPDMLHPPLKEIKRMRVLRKLGPSQTHKLGHARLASDIS